MKSRWTAPTAEFGGDALAECVYGSRVLGSHPDLVLHGGGNSSIKDRARDITGASREIIYVKGSGWDMATIAPGGFAPMRLERLRELLGLDQISDPQMVNELRCALVDASAPDPSIESLLHALLPHRAVLHSHADAVVTLSNQLEPAAHVRELYGDSVVVVSYVMPGFDLARTCARLWPEHAHAGTVGMVLLNHGLFTFGETMEVAYARHLELITAAEEYIAERRLRAPVTPSSPVEVEEGDPTALASFRNDVSRAAGRPMIVSRYTSPRVAQFLGRRDVEQVLSRGPATPDHVIRTKCLPLLGTNVQAYADAYEAYYERNRKNRGDVEMLDPAPRVVLGPPGLRTVGKTAKDADAVRDIALHTLDIIEAGEAIGSYTALPEGDLFDVEYWELEQAKLRLGGPPPPLSGQVALVTGAASGIGLACARHLARLGASIIAVDISDKVCTASDGPGWLGLQADLTDRAALQEALGQGVDRFGGLDIVVVAAGVFAESAPIPEVDERIWDRTLAVNVDSVLALFGQVHSLLRLSPTRARVVLIGSKNVAAPGPGAAAYSASKAAVTQLARVAAIEWAPDGIRVNVVHPDAVFDTGLWTAELLSERASRYGITVEEYKRRNLLSAEVTSDDVAHMVGAMCTEPFAATTGAQVPVDGGNERVI